MSKSAKSYKFNPLNKKNHLTRFREIRWFFEFHRSAAPAGQRSCGLDEVRSLVVKMPKVWRPCVAIYKIRKLDFIDRVPTHMDSANFDNLFTYFIKTTLSLTGRGRRPMKFRIIESSWFVLATIDQIAGYTLLRGNLPFMSLSINFD